MFVDNQNSFENREYSECFKNLNQKPKKTEKWNKLENFRKLKISIFQRLGKYEKSKYSEEFQKFGKSKKNLMIFEKLSFF